MVRSAGLTIAAGALLVAGFLAGGNKEGEWPCYSGDNGAKKYSPLAQINKSNVGRLRIAWRRPHLSAEFVASKLQPGVGNNFRSTPIMVGGVLYASNGVALAEAIDPETGRTIWAQKAGNPLPPAFSNRGVAYWGRGTDARILTYRERFLYALSAKTGEAIPGFGEGGRVDIDRDLPPGANTYRWNSPPLVVGDVVVMGSSLVEQDSAAKMQGEPGIVRAYDVRTGKLRWNFNPIPTKDDPGIETWEEGSWQYTGAANVWAPMSADDELGLVFLPTTSPTNDMYGGHRLGSNLFSTSIVCLDARNGRRVWHFQTVHHDLFDYDNPAAPILADITVDGRRVKAVVQVTKQAFAFVLDRVTGEQVWPIEERPVPASTVPGERASATQPFPTKPPAFDRQGITEEDLIDFTPELRAEALEIVKHYVIGPVFTPPSVQGDDPGDKKGTIQVPGSVGGANWTGAAFDPDTGMLYVPSMTNPFVANLLPGDPRVTNLRYRAGSRALIQGPRGLPLLKPPYGRITALDLRNGTIAWMVPNGDGPRDHPAIKHLDLPSLGQAVRASVLATKTLLFVTEGDQSNVRTPPGGGGRKVRALDKATGETLWEMELEAGATAAPMTYMHKGKQYILVAIGSGQYTAEFVAFSLP
jgi:quinoprotein glucose dehydrogenase